MEIIAESDFNNFSNIRVVTARILSSEKFENCRKLLVKAINNFLRDNHCDYLFIDEMIPLPAELTGPSRDWDLEHI